MTRMIYDSVLEKSLWIGYCPNCCRDHCIFESPDGSCPTCQEKEYQERIKADWRVLLWEVEK